MLTKFSLFALILSCSKGHLLNLVPLLEASSCTKGALQHCFEHTKITPLINHGGSREHVSRILLHNVQRGICSLVLKHIYKAPALLSSPSFNRTLLNWHSQRDVRENYRWGHFLCAAVTDDVRRHHFPAATLATSFVVTVEAQINSKKRGKKMFKVMMCPSMVSCPFFTPPPLV